MTDASLRHAIQQALAACAVGPLAAHARTLLALLGYQSERVVDVGPAAADFLATFDPDGRLRHDHACVALWRSVALVFQLTGAELVRDAQRLAGAAPPAFDAQTYHAFLFFALDLAAKPAGRPYTRAELAAMTREFNKLFPMPVSLIVRYPAADGTPLLTFALVTHRPSLRDASRDVLVKVSLIRDLSLHEPHRAHVAILADLALPQLTTRQAVAGFDDLQRAWARTLDCSELNRRFYREIANWYFWAVQQVAFPEDGMPPARRNADRVIRLITRLIFVWFLREKGLVDRALFQRTSVEPLLVTLADDASSYYLAILQNLFFATLNQEMGQRAFRRPGQNYGVANLYRHAALFRDAQAALALFARIPFLNGGLFECLDDLSQQPPLRIDAFSDRPDSQPSVPNALFFTAEALTVDLNATYGTRGRRYSVRGILEILESYKFTVAENTPVEEDVALDPELLGQVFENLLAAYNPETETTARKETGSFYTPRSVVAYMVDESLLLYLQDAPVAEPVEASGALAEPVEATGALAEPVEAARLRRLLAYNDDDPASAFTPAERRHLIRALDALTVIDPACGSGAFPMGMLQKLVYLLGKLDPGNRAWKERQIARAERIEDVMAREAAIEGIEEAFERNDLDYGRKLFLIENVIYGVDIQPIAVQIAKLRCFISLIVEQQVDDARPNRGIRPLPNLETKFVAADALKSVERPTQLSFRDPALEALERDLARVRSAHFNARTPATKRKYRERDQAMRAELGTLLQRSGFSGDAAAALATWDPYAQNRCATFFDAEWMFGREAGFDIVIANPPYVRQEQIKERKPELERRYETYTGTADLYVYFYERAMQLLKTGGVLTFISSNKFFRAGYGKKLRAYLASAATIHQLIDFGDAPVFTAIAYPSIIIAQKRAPAAEGREHQLLALTWNPTSRLEEFPQIIAAARAAAASATPAAPLILQRSLTADGWRLEGAATQRLLAKLRRAGKPLGDYVGGRFYYGIKTGLNEAFVVDRATRERLIAADPASAELLKPFLRGRDVKRWRVDFAEQYLIKVASSENVQHPWSHATEAEAERIFAQCYPAIHNWLAPLRERLIKRADQGRYFWELRSCAYWQEFEQPKIILGRFMNHAMFAFDQQSFYHNDALYMIAGANAYVVAILNSNVSWWFLSQLCTDLQNGYLQAFRKDLFQLPIPAISNPTPLTELVERILTLKAADGQAEAAALERELNERVYGLYGLRPDEIRAIDEQGGA